MTQKHLFVTSGGAVLDPVMVTESDAILGKKGSGKTSAGVVLFEEMYALGVPVVAVAERMGPEITATDILMGGAS